MPPPPEITLGPLTQRMLSGSVWSDATPFPAWQGWADDAESILRFLETQRVLDQFMPRLHAREWEGAFAEARVGYFFQQQGFQVLGWEPRAVPDHPGDIEIQWPDTDVMFVEVKGPGWEGELTIEERAAGRKQEPKYQNNDFRSVGSVDAVLKAIDKALPKFASDRGNVVAVADDLFFSPLEIPEPLLGAIVDYVKDADYSLVSGVLLLQAIKPTDHPVEYRHYFIANPMAHHPVPTVVIDHLIAGNWHERF
jgi:hypothetical protein